MTNVPKKHGQYDTPQSALAHIRRKMEDLSREYAAGKLNATQFSTLYQYYSDKRSVIETLLERNPNTDAWQAAASDGHTTFLRARFEARPLYYVVFRRGDKQPLLSEGKLTKGAAQQVYEMIKIVWRLQTWRKGLARKAVGDGSWILLVMSEESLTLIVFSQLPSPIQVIQMRDLQSDFERANEFYLKRQGSAERMVFPHRALLTDSP